MNKNEVKDEFSKQNMTNQQFLCKCKIFLDGVLVETLIPFKSIVAFENNSGSRDEHMMTKYL